MAKKPASGKNEYGARSIRVMEGLEAVRKRPAMYIGSTSGVGLHYMVYEVVDNSVDEALAGHCDSIEVILHTDGSCSVEDNGRGIPVDIHPTEKISAAEVVMTKLHAGGKFDKDSYKYSGGLHGVGVSVVNALSSSLILEVFKNGKVHKLSFSKGKPSGSLEVVGETKKNGTQVRFIPDSTIFTETTKFNFDTLASRLRELAFLNKGLKITITDENTNENAEFFFEGGIVSFIKHINSKKTPVFPDVINFEKTDDKYVLEIAIQYNDSYGEQIFSFVNNINTRDGGTHVSGFKSALTKICNKKAQELNVLKSGDSYSSEDVREGLVCVINMKVPEPQFEGQTKGKLGNSDVKGIVDSWTFACLDTFFEENPGVCKKILQKAQLARQAREAAKKARELTRKKTGLETSLLPGKLADCSNDTPSTNEIFIVEGDSAGGSAKQARDRNTQAILPLRGKILNVEKSRLDRVLSNEEIKALIAAVGCGIGVNDFNVEKARYHKVILMTDADVDGSHIRTLLLTFFFRHMKPLVEKGYLYIAQPPLYKAKIGKRERYLKDEGAFRDFIFDWASEHLIFNLDGTAIDSGEITKLLEKLKLYEEELEKASTGFKIASRQCHQLVNFLRKKPWDQSQSVSDLLDDIREHFSKYTVSISEEEMLDSEAENRKKVLVIFRTANKEWSVPVQFFSSEEAEALLEQLKDLTQIEDKAWKIEVSGKDRNISNQGIFELISALTTISKPYMNIQRYKGLGEMNPEQLWETAMDPNTRSLLKVKIEDGLKADAWFSTLMGDDVSGRKKYIEEYGHFVKNLDV